MSDDIAASKNSENEEVHFATHVARKVTLNWYEFEYAFELELLREYISGIEQQVSNSIEVFSTRNPLIVKRFLAVYENGRPEYNKEIYRGVSSENYSLDGVFGLYFPSLQRSSALITLCGMFEHELDNLCALFAKERNYCIQVGDINGKGIERAIKYLEKVAGLEIKKHKAWADYKEIQKIRNLVVHNGSRLIDKSGNPHQVELKYVKDSPFLEGEEEIIFMEGFLSFTIDVFGALSKAIDDAIQDKFGFKPEPLPPELEEYIKNLPPYSGNDTP